MTGRGLAWTWRGNLAQAVRVYPLGPLAFALALLGVGYLGVALVTGRRAAWALPAGMRNCLMVAAVALVALNWVSKLVWLGT